MCPSIQEISPQDSTKLGGTELLKGGPYFRGYSLFEQCLLWAPEPLTCYTATQEFGGLIHNVAAPQEFVMIMSANGRATLQSPHKNLGGASLSTSHDKDVTPS